MTDWTLSGVSLVHSRKDNQLLQQFKQEIDKIVVCAPNPRTMQELVEKEDSQPNTDFSNFVAFYKWIAQERPECIMELWKNLKEINPAFVNTKLSGDESMKRLQARFNTAGTDVWYNFTVLSTGEKMLMALYLLTSYCAADHRYLFIDEPDNFLYLAEIQPWLFYMEDRNADGMQCVMISHHPVVMDYLAGSSGIWLKRSDYRATRVVDAPETQEPLSASEYIVRENNAL